MSCRRYKSPPPFESPDPQYGKSKGAVSTGWLATKKRYEKFILHPEFPATRRDRDRSIMGLWRATPHEPHTGPSVERSHRHHAVLRISYVRTPVNSVHLQNEIRTREVSIPIRNRLYSQSEADSCTPVSVAVIRKSGLPRLSTFTLAVDADFHQSGANQRAGSLRHRPGGAC